MQRAISTGYRLAEESAAWSLLMRARHLRQLERERQAKAPPAKKPST